MEQISKSDFRETAFRFRFHDVFSISIMFDSTVASSKTCMSSMFINCNGFVLLVSFPCRFYLVSGIVVKGTMPFQANIHLISDTTKQSPQNKS